MASSAFSFDDLSGDSGGESLGSGLDGGALDLTGSSLDELTPDLLQGSSLDLGGVGTEFGVTDSLSAMQDFQLSGVTDTAPSFTEDSSILGSEFNGAGSAESTHPLSVSSPDNVSSFLSGVSKFGSSIGQLFARGATSAQPVLANSLPNRNPNRPAPTTGISGNHAFLLVGVVIVIGAAIALGGGKHGV